MDINILTQEQKRLVEENIKLAYHLANNFYNIKFIDEDDLDSIATMGLIKAARTFDESKNIKFTSYAGRCINNEILMAIRKDRKKYENLSSLDDILNIDSDGHIITLSDITPDPKSDFIQPMIVSADFEEIINIIFNALKKDYRLTVLYLLGNKKQREIGDALGFSRSYVSKICKKSILQIKERIPSLAKEKLSFKEIFSIQLDIDRFYISFFNSDVPYFHQAYANLLNSNPNITRLISLLNHSNENKTLFCMLNLPQSFISIAQLFQEMDRISAMQITKPVDSLKIIRNYFLSLKVFTIKDLIARFPNEKTFLIRSAVHLAEIKGLITPLGKGNYIVNKTKP